MDARVDLGSHQITPRVELKVLGLWIDGKLRWGPYIKKIQGRMASPKMQLIKVAGSTWGSTFNKARQALLWFT